MYIYLDAQHTLQAPSLTNVIKKENSFFVNSNLSGSLYLVEPPPGMLHVCQGVQRHQAVTDCEQDLTINLPGCFHLLFLLSFKRKTKKGAAEKPH